MQNVSWGTGSLATLGKMLKARRLDVAAQWVDPKELHDVIVHGVKGTAMVAKKSVLGGEQGVQAVLAYIRKEFSYQPDLENGLIAFDNHCSSCHQASFRTHKSIREVVRTIRHGNDAGMPALLHEMHNKDTVDIAAYLVGLSKH